MAESAGTLDGRRGSSKLLLKNPDSRELQDMHHMSVNRTLFLARKVIPNINGEDVRQIARTCDRCRSIDPALNVHEVG